MSTQHHLYRASKHRKRQHPPKTYRDQQDNNERRALNGQTEYGPLRPLIPAPSKERDQGTQHLYKAQQRK